MRQSKRCPKCTGNRIGVITGVFDHWTVSLGDELGSMVGLPAGATATAQSELEQTAYLCAECGYYETYLSHPQQIDYTKLKGQFAWLSPPAAPFR